MKFEPYLTSIYPMTITVGEYETERCQVTIVLSGSSRDAAYVPYCTIRYHAVPYVPYCIMLYHTVSYCTMLYHTVPCCIILYHVVPYVPYCIILYHAVSYCTMLYHTVPCCIILYHAVSYCTMLYHTVSCSSVHYVFRLFVMCTSHSVHVVTVLCSIVCRGFTLANRRFHYGWLSFHYRHLFQYYVLSVVFI